MMKRFLPILLGAVCLCFRAAGADNCSPIDRTPHGICAHVSRWEYPRAADEFKLMKQIGIGWVRTDLDWNAVEPRQGEWDDSRWDSLLKMAEEHDIGLLPILGAPPRWATPATGHMDLYLKYVDHVLDHYGDRLTHLEVWNEPGGEAFPTGEDYGRLLLETSRRIRAKKPHIKIVFGGIAGIDIPYIAAALKTAGKDSFDIMNVHCYNWVGAPEESHKQRLEELGEFMEKNGIGGKPIWLTECGYSTAAGRNFLDHLLPPLMKELGVQPGKCVAILFDDSDYEYRAGKYVAEKIPGVKEIKTIRFKELSRLAPDPDTVLILGEDEVFPARYIPDLLEYVRRGGKLLSPGGLPLYYELERSAQGKIAKNQVGSKHMREFHIGWEGFWTRQGVPNGTDNYEFNPAFADELKGIPYLPEFRFLTGDNLREGDRFVPILYGVRKEYRGALAGVYHLNSELKGKIACCSILSRSNEMITEERQAHLVPRLLLAAYSGGAEKISLYNFRSNEWSAHREADFGIVHENLSPKPAYETMKTFITCYPAGSSRPRLTNFRDVYLASWKQPDGTGVHAVWIAAPGESAQRETPRSITLRCSGDLERVIDCFGRPVEAEKLPGNRVQLTVGPGIHYLVGPGSVGL